MNAFLIAAGGYAVFVTFLHIIAGGKTVAQPLLEASDIETAPKYVNYYCWHLVSFNLALMSALILLAALNSEWMELVWVGLAQAIFSFVWGVFLPVWKNLTYKDVPQGWLFAPLILLTVAGLNT